MLRVNNEAGEVALKDVRVAAASISGRSSGIPGVGGVTYVYGDSKDDALVTIECRTRKQGRKSQVQRPKAEQSDGVVLVMRAGRCICICMRSARDHNE